MNFEDSSLYIEVKDIISRGANPVFDFYTAQIHLANEDMDVLKIVQIDIDRDYERSFTDTIVLTAVLPLGKYAKRVYPERNNLEITIKRKPMLELGSNEDTSRGPVIERYVAVLMNQGNPLIEGDDYNIPSEDALDLSQLVNVAFQLIPKSVDQLRMKSVGGVFRGGNSEETLKTVLTRESQTLDLPKELLPLGIDMVPSTNKNKRDHIVIPHGVKLIDLPQYLQDKCGGLYSSGVGFYYQNKHWYLYPLYDTERFDTTTDKVTIINVPGNKLVGVERTYRKDGSNTIILSTGNVKFKDISDHQQLSNGNGVRFAEASIFMDGFVQTKNNKTISARGANVNEVISTSRQSGRQNVHVSDTRITSNVAKEYSSLARREGAIINLLWENANPDLIFPGIPVKILYLEDDEIREITGVVLKAQEFVHMKGQVMFSNTHYVNLGLSVFVNRKKIKI